MDDGEEKQSPGYPAEMLYVVESIELTKNDSATATDPPKLVLLPGKLLVTHKNLTISTKLLSILIFF